MTELQYEHLPSAGPEEDTLWWPTTALQRGLIAHTLMGGSAADPYIGQTSIRLDGELGAEEARTATLGLLRRVQNLRAGFLLDESGDPVCFIEPFDPGTALRAFSTADADLESIAAAELAAGFDLADPPLLRFTLIEEGAGHQLLVTAHHTVLDGWSMPLLIGQWLRELAQVRGIPAPAQLPEATGSYAAHLAWVAGADRQAAAGFYATTLAHAETGPAPHWLGQDAGQERHTLRRELNTAGVAALTACCRKAGITQAAALRTAWALAADFVAGTTGSVFAVPVALRNPELAGAQNICGMLTETTLVSVDYAPQDTVSNIARRHQGWWSQSLEHQHLGVPAIERALGAETELAWSLLSFETTHDMDSYELPGLRATPAGTRDGSHYPVNVHVSAGETWQIELEHDTRVPAHTAEALAQALMTALHALAGESGPVAGLRLMDQDAVRGFETSGRHYPSELPLLPELFTAQAAATPDACAVVAGGERYSYRDLDRLAAEAAARMLALLAEDTTGGAPILALRTARGIEPVIGHLAALRSGIALMPLDTAWPAARVERALQLSGAALIWDAQGLRATGTDTPRVPRPDAVRPGDTASIIFTSGSTGEPKGVAVPHRALAQLFARQQRELYPEGQRLAVAHTSAFHFDAHWDAFLALFAGHELHVLTEDEYLDPFALADYVKAQGIGYLDFTPTLWNALLSSGALETLPQICVAGGEGFPAGLWTRMRELAEPTGARVYNLYGPTEATVDALAAEVSGSAEPVVGRPVGATGALVLDAMLRRVPPGTVGELYLAGPQLADGYLARPALTASRFTAHPEDPGQRLYRTGDAASWRPDGQLALLGRTDAQISLHGVRIEPGEIEAFLTAQDTVRRAAVLKVTDPRLGERLAAWVVPADPGAVHDTALAARLRESCAAGLPRAMVPAAVVLLQALPVTGSGKLDARALPAPDFGHSGATTQDAAGAPAAELAAVSAAIHGVLNLDADPEPGERFVALGGDSIAAIQVIAALHRAGYSYSVAKLLAAGTPAAMARELTALPGQRSGAGDAAGRVAQLDEARLAALTAQAAAAGGTPVDLWELTPTQLGMVLHHEREANGTYQTTTRWSITAPDTARLPSAAQIRAALDTLSERHPQFRGIVFQHDLPAPRLAILDAVRWDLEQIDLRKSSYPQVVARGIEQRLRAEPTDLATGPLLRGALLRTTDASWEVVLCLHHLLVDGWSTALLTEQLHTLLDGGELGDPVPMTGYLEWLRELEDEAGVLEQAWRSEFAGFGAPTTLAALTDPAAGTVRATSHLDTAATTDLARTLRAAGHTLADAAQAAWASVLAAATGTSDVALGATRSGRDAEVPGIAQSVGMFITTAPVRLQPRPGAPAAELLDEARRQNTELARAAHLGMGRIKSVLGAEPFDTLLVVENYPHREEAQDPAALQVAALGGEDGTNYPVCFTLTPGPELALEVELSGGDPLIAAALAAAARTALAALAGGTQPGPEDLGLGSLRAAQPAAHPPLEVAIPAQEDAPAPQSSAGAGDERTMLAAQAVAEVLGLPAVDPARDIFALGADSMAVIALVGALRSRGLVLSLGEIYRNPTAASIAAAAGAAQPAGTATLAAHGPLEATAALGWYTSLLQRTGAEGRGFQQLRVLNLPAGTNPEAVHGALTALVERHPALRLRVDGAQLEVGSRPWLSWHALPQGSGQRDFTEALRSACAGIDERAGHLLAALYRPADTGYATLALAVHHVAVDIYSWRLIVEELRLLITDPQAPALPAAGSLRSWAAAGTRAAATLEQDNTLLERWLAVLRPGVQLSEAEDYGTLAEAAEDVHTLDEPTTARLLALGERYGMDTVLNAAVAGALEQHSQGAPGSLVIEAEGHGRPAGTRYGDARDAVEVGSTIGWFTATWPVRLTAAQGGPAGWLTAARAAAAAVPQDPTSYGLLRYLTDRAGRRLAQAEAAARPQLLINYLGREAAQQGAWQPATDAAELETSLGLHHQLPATHPVELNSYVTDSGQGAQLVLRWQLAAASTAGTALPGQVRRALEELAGLDAVETAAPGTRRPLHDVVGLGARETALLLTARPDAEAIWPLTGVQQAMAVHAAAAPADTYLSLAGLELHGDLDPEVLRRAVAALAGAHPQLRATVYWPEDGSPVLVPVAGLVPGLDVRRAHGLGLEQRAELAERVRSEHMRWPFDLERGPLLRLELIDFGTHPQDGEPHWQLVIANHHLLLDGWSIPPLVAELLEHYADLATGGSPAPAVPAAASGYDAFARTLAGRDDAAQVDQWRELLAGAGHGHVLRHRDAANTELPRVIGHELAPSLHAQLRAAVRRASATVADAAAAAWALVLAALLETGTPVFGTVSSGRAIEVPGIRSMPGMFIDTLPVALDLETAGDSRGLLAAAHAAGQRIIESAGVPLSKITAALGVGTLFDTLLVVENYPDSAAEARPGAPRLGQIHSQDATEYPLGLSVAVGEGLSVELEHSAEVDRATAQAVLSATVVALECLALGTELPVLRRLLDARLAGARRALAEAASRHGAVPASGGAPAQLVAAAYAEVLGAGTVAEEADFFALGGDSMGAMALLSALRGRGYRATISQVFANPIAADLARQLTPLPRAQDQPPAPAPAAPGKSAPAAPGAAKPMISLDGAAMASLTDLLRGN